MIKQKFSVLSILCFILVNLFLVSSAIAEEKKSLGKFQAWEAFEYQENGQKVCYIASQPQKSEGKYAKRGSVWFMVTHGPGQKENNVISMMTGYPFNPDCNGSNKNECLVRALIGSHKFYLYTQDSTAWGFPTYNGKMVKAMKAGKNMIILGKSSRGTDTKDTISLLGFTAAYKKISEACGIKD